MTQIQRHIGYGSHCHGRIRPAPTTEGAKWPDIVANMRVDRPWGSAQIMGAVHDVSANYYGSSGSYD